MDLFQKKLSNQKFNVQMYMAPTVGPRKTDHLEMGHALLCRAVIIETYLKASEVIIQCPKGVQSQDTASSSWYTPKFHALSLETVTMFRNYIFTQGMLCGKGVCISEHAQFKM